jgi:uncharacterized protein YkwD
VTSPNVGNPSDSPNGGSGTGNGTGAGNGTGSTTGTGNGTTGSGTGTPDSRRQEVCTRWRNDRQDVREGDWSGAVASCSAGDLSSDGRDRALKLLNLYRFLADLPPVTHDRDLDTKAQGCALMMDANQALSHDPPKSWTCYNDVGADAAGHSNISSGPAVGSMDLYMIDPGNDSTLGHRRWMLSNSLGPVGIGSTSSASCLWVIGGAGDARKPWVAWPPPGPVPSAALTTGGSVDETGWSIESSDLDLTDAQISVSDGTQDLPVTVNQLGQGYGETFAVRWLPNGWKTQAGHSYRITATAPKLSAPISYTFEVVDCG